MEVPEWLDQMTSILVGRRIKAAACEVLEKRIMGGRKQEGASEKSDVHLQGISESTEGGTADLALCWVRTFMVVFPPCSI